MPTDQVILIWLPQLSAYKLLRIYIHFKHYLQLNFLNSLTSLQL